MIFQAYVASSYTSLDPEKNLLNIRAAIKAGLRLLAYKGIHPIIPHASMNHHPPSNEAMRTCLATIRSLNPATDCLVLLPGWETSKGATQERALALEIGLPVLTLAEALQ